MTLLPPQLGQLGVLIAEYTVSLTGTRPTVGLIYVGLAKAIAGTPTPMNQVCTGGSLVALRLANTNR